MSCLWFLESSYKNKSGDSFTGLYSEELSKKVDWINSDLKKILLQNIKPKEAYAIHLLDNLSSLEILTLSDDWLTGGIESESLFKLYSVDPTNHNDITSLFVKTIHELNVSELNKINGSKEIVKVIFKKMINHKIDIGAASYEVKDIVDNIEVEHNDTSTNKYYGRSLNLEVYLSLYYELSDLYDCSRSFSSNATVKLEIKELKIREELVSEARKWIVDNFTNTIHLWEWISTF